MRAAHRSCNGAKGKLDQLLLNGAITEAEFAERLERLRADLAARWRP